MQRNWIEVVVKWIFSRECELGIFSEMIDGIRLLEYNVQNGISIQI